MNHRTTSIALAFALAFGASASEAGLARFDTTSFGYSVSGASLSWSAGDQYQRLDTEAQSAGGRLGFDSASGDWSDWSSQALGASTPYANASASAAAQSLGGSAAASRTALDELASHASRSYANQSGVFSLDRDGVVTFTIGWRIEVQGDAADPVADYAQAMMALLAGAYDGSSAVSRNAELFSFDASGGADVASGTWIFDVALAAGQQGYYDLTGTASAEASARAANAVPEPAGLALVGIGLAGLAGVRRRASSRRRP